MQISTCLRWAAMALATLVLAGCYASETAILDATTSAPIPGVSEGTYCHAENRLLPPQVTVAPTISEALGENKCRDLHWDADRGRYVDSRSSSMVFRTAPMMLAPLSMIQAQTGEGALARYMPVAAVDGMFILYDPSGEWPADLIAASGLTLREDGALGAADPAVVSNLLESVRDRVLADFRADIAFVEDADGPRLEFRRVDLAYRYLVYFREDWSGDSDRMRGAMLELVDALGLGRYEETWTEDRE